MAVAEISLKFTLDKSVERATDELETALKSAFEKLLGRYPSPTEINDGAQFYTCPDLGETRCFWKGQMIVKQKLFFVRTGRLIKCETEIFV